MYFSLLRVGTGKSKLEHPISHPSRSPLFIPSLVSPPRKPRRSTRPLAARTMARIVNLHSTFINREIKAILARCPRSNADQILHTGSPRRVTLSWNYSREEKLGMAGRSRCIADELFVENFWKIRFDSFIADYDTRGKVDAREKISGETVLPRFSTIVIAPTRHVGPSSFCFRHPSFISRANVPMLVGHRYDVFRSDVSPFLSFLFSSPSNDGDRESHF